MNAASAAVSGSLLQSIDQHTKLAGHNRLALLLFRLSGEQLFGINVFKVQEVVPRPAILGMPHSHAHVIGVARIREQTIPVLDLSVAVGEPPLPKGMPGLVVVTEYNRTIQGFLVGAVERIVHVGVDTVRPPPPAGPGGGYLTAVTHIGEKLVQIIDVEQVLAEVTGGARDVSAEVLARVKARGKPVRVLVADDSRVARSQIESILTQLGAECVMASDGREALKLLRSLAEGPVPVTQQLAMVISDIEMPDMDGYTLATEIRRDPRLAGLYVMLHTSLSGVFNNAMVQRVGANRFIPKFKPDELAMAVLDRLDTMP